MTRHSPWHTRRARLFPALALPATLSLPGLALAPAALESAIAPPAPPAAVAWTEPLADQPKPPAAEVLRDAPALARVSLVTVRAREGRPVATITVAANRTEAATLVGQARINPEVLAVSVSEEVHGEQAASRVLDADYYPGENTASTPACRRTVRDGGLARGNQILCGGATSTPQRGTSAPRPLICE